MDHHRPGLQPAGQDQASRPGETPTAAPPAARTRASRRRRCRSNRGRPTVPARRPGAATGQPPAPGAPVRLREHVDRPCPRPAVPRRGTPAGGRASPRPRRRGANTSTDRRCYAPQHPFRREAELLGEHGLAFVAHEGGVVGGTEEDGRRDAGDTCSGVAVHWLWTVTMRNARPRRRRAARRYAPVCHELTTMTSGSKASISSSTSCGRAGPSTATERNPSVRTSSSNGASSAAASCTTSRSTSSEPARAATPRGTRTTGSTGRTPAGCRPRRDHFRVAASPLVVTPILGPGTVSHPTRGLVARPRPAGPADLGRHQHQARWAAATWSWIQR